MSKYRVRPFGLDRVRTYPLKNRTSKVSVQSFATPHRKGDKLSQFLESLPIILAAENLRDLAQAIFQAQNLGKPIIWGLGGHVIKTGLTPVLVDLMDRGMVTALALNGAGIIHDFEIAVVGATSEDVETQLETGEFGMAEETGSEINHAISQGAREDLGIGESLGKYLSEKNFRFGEMSLLQQAYLRSIPVTVHVTLGTDIVHNHPSVSPADTGSGSHLDFRLFASLVAGLDDGGVYLNCGSAVTLPEVFLKSVSLVRNSGETLKNFTTANLDFIQHYRPIENVIKRPIQGGGRGISITGHHEIVIPLLAAWLVELAPMTSRDA